MPDYHDNRQGQPTHGVLMTVVGNTYVVYAPTAFSDRWTNQQGPTLRVRLWRSLTRLASFRPTQPEQVSHPVDEAV